MGMDLFSVSGTSGISYNWTAWRWLIGKLNEWGVDTSEFTDHNDGDRISADTCRAVADALEAHIDEIDDLETREFYREGIQAWRECNGFRQW
ncbi:MAG: hypothetical protein FJW39_34410 [Acidobacteria bacterium]|nr:hypothetical protein [Acidobacteriota bacterium]